jgi:hypothetical protein
MFGVAFGLFAIFSILRYRTVSIPIREMGYFFTCVTLGIINSMTNYQEHFYEILFSNIIAILLIIILDKFFSVERENFQIMVYDKLELIKPENKTLLIEDIRNRTGLPVINTKIEHIDLSKNLCRLKVYFILTVRRLILESTQDDDELIENFALYIIFQSYLLLGNRFMINNLAQYESQIWINNMGVRISKLIQQRYQFNFQTLSISLIPNSDGSCTQIH